MTSLIFGSIYLGHKGFVQHRREKQRQKNYQRWEGLRDEYDEQRRISRETRSLDIQRTGATDYTSSPYGAGSEPQDLNRYTNDTAADIDRPILTLRDQQEANDARTSWRPQESFDGPPPAINNNNTYTNRRASVEVTAGSGLRPISKNKTGATWDEGLPDRLPVTRRNWDDYNQSPSNLSRSSSTSARGGAGNKSTTPTPVRERSSTRSPPSTTSTIPATTAKRGSPLQHETTTSSSSNSRPHPLRHDTVEVIEHDTPGGRMAELIDFASSTTQPITTSTSTYPPSQYQLTAPPPPPPPPPFIASHHAPFSPSPAYPPIQSPPVPSPTFSPGQFGPGFQHPSAVVGAGVPPPTARAQDGSMEEWWTRPL